MLISPHIPGKEYGYSTCDTGWVSGDPLRFQVSSMVILPKTLGEEYGYPTNNPRWVV